MGSSKEKIKNAYLLIYERTQHFDPEEKAPEAESEKKKSEESKEDKDETMESSTTTSVKERKLTNESQADSVKNEDEDAMKNIPKEFLRQIIEKNQVFHLRKYVFSKEFFEFVKNTIMEREYIPNPTFCEKIQFDPEKNQREYFDFELLKLGVIFFLTGIIRDRARNGIIKFLPFLKVQLVQVILYDFLIRAMTC